MAFPKQSLLHEYCSCTGYLPLNEPCLIYTLWLLSGDSFFLAIIVAYFCLSFLVARMKENYFRDGDHQSWFVAPRPLRPVAGR